MTGNVQSQSFLNPDLAPPRRPWLGRLTLIAVSVLLLSNLVAALMAAGYQIYYDGHIFPGVSVWGVDLSGMDPAEAAAALEGQFTYPQDTIITLRYGEMSFPLTAAELGVRFDAQRTVQAAYEIGRHPSVITSLGQQSTAWRQGIVVSPVIVFNQVVADSYLQQIALAINQPKMDAAVNVQGYQALATPSQVGRQVDIPATIEALGSLVTTLQSGEVEVVVVETPPTVVSAEEAARQVSAILAADLEVYIENPYPDDPGPWIATRQALAEMIILELVPQDDSTAAYDVRLNEDQLRAFLEPLGPSLERQPVNARFVFEDGVGTLTPIAPSQPGRSLDAPATIQVINQRILEGQHRIPLVFKTTDPEVPDTATAEQLGITELVSSATTYFYGSSQERRANIQVAASRFHGVVVPPGGTFSFVHYLGEVSVETGFEQALIIYDGRTIRGVGGGVCQVSTTAFQAAFYGGFPIVERVPHGYWVSYYDAGEGAGMDATVFEPVVDLKFQNDLPTYLLIETVTDTRKTTVTFRFYSTNDGRTIQKDGPYIANKVPHGPPIYELNESLPRGTVKQVDWAVDGFDATVNRIVYRNGQIIRQDSFFSRYVPWQDVFQYGPGASVPGGSSGYTASDWIRWLLGEAAVWFGMSG